MKNSAIIKCLEYSIAVIFFVFLITSELNVPPSNYLITMYCDVFNTNEYYVMAIALVPTLIWLIPVHFIRKKLNSNLENINKNMETDEPYIHNNALPVWIVPISGWGSTSKENAHKRMEAYNAIAAAMKINIEFTSRLGTFGSYKNAPSVAKEIREHNEKTFAVYDDLLGKDWRIKFNDEVKKMLPVDEE